MGEGERHACPGSLVHRMFSGDGAVFAAAISLLDTGGQTVNNNVAEYFIWEYTSFLLFRLFRLRHLFRLLRLHCLFLT